jgi:cytochrome c5
MPEFSDQRLEAGRAIWMGTCRNCHLLGVAGAPAVTDFAEWEARLTKGKEALYESALHGVRGDDGLYRMPPQGGNQRLSQEQVRLAVDYKVAAIEQLRAQRGDARAQ